MKKYGIIIGILFAAFCLFSLAATPSYAYIVYPDDPYWGPDDRTAAENTDNAGTAGISAEQPRSGNASLKLTLGGSDNYLEDLDDWAFYTRTAVDEGKEYWGRLSEVSALSFDWFVDSIDTSNVGDDDPFNWQTPVLRLLIEDQGTISELIWEQYYTEGPTTVDTEGNTVFDTGTWFTEDLMDQYFWQYISSTPTEEDPTGYVTDSGSVLDDFTGHALMAETIYDWSLLSDFFSSDAVVYGISVGVGSYWKGAYLGYVDNVLLSFTTEDTEESDGYTYTVLNDNFEIPEPSTLLLLGTGLATLLTGRRRRARG